jgi:riboflavin kinase/FMN adenylyltransferase
MSLRALVAGVDFRCGCGRDTDVAALRRLLTPANIGVFPVPPVTWGGEPVSSSRIRAAVHAGNFDATREMMGAPFEIDLCAAADALPPPTSRFHFAAEQVGYLVPNTDQILPRTGAYAASVITSGGESIDSVAEVSLAGVRYTLPPGNRHAPLSLRFHRRVAGNDDAL